MDLPRAGFSEDGYRALLQAFARQGYRTVRFEPGELSSRTVILRHDVDFALESAVRIGEIETSLGWHSTFFVLVATEFYNLCTRHGRQGLRALQAQGHEIGLHFDRTVYPGQDEHEAAQRECMILEDLLGSEVRVIAHHRPAQMPDVLGWEGLFAGRTHAYAPAFFSRIAYVSDSAGYWSHGSPLEHAAFRKGGPMQVLTHPYLWMGEAHETARDHIERARRAREAFLISEYRRNLRYYPPAES